LHKRSKCVYVFMAVLLTAMSAFGQAPAPAPAPAQTPATPPPPPPPWSVGSIDFSGLVDAYYNFNFNHPASGINGPGIMNFDSQANQFSLNMMKLSMTHAVDPIGFQIDLGFGKAFDTINAGEPAGGLNTKNIEQAYISYKPNKDKNLQFDFGKWVTSAGAEVIESHSNWNYSRSDLFALAIPYYHMGLRITDTWGKFTGGFQVVNGWNNVVDNNTGKTVGFVANIVGKKAMWNNNFYTGPENTGTNTGWRNLYDTTFMVMPSDKFNAYVNFDYGRNRPAIGKFTGPGQEWVGIAGAAKFQFNDRIALTPRIEWFDDTDGFAGLGAKMKEFTLTYEYKWAKGLLTRFEYRHDWADKPVFEAYDSLTNTHTLPKDHQDTLTVAFIAFFGPK
jgi:hypothetical protein